MASDQPNVIQLVKSRMRIQPGSLVPEVMLQKLICTALHEKMVMGLFYSKIYLVNCNISSRRNIVWQLK